MQTYDTYKHSGIDWLGEIPSHWEVESFKNILVERTKKNDPILSTERLSLSIDKGVTLYSDKTTNLDRFKDDFTQYKLAYEGDLVFNSMNMIVGAVGVSNFFGCVSPVYYTYYSKNGNSTKFYEYLFRSRLLQGVLYSLGQGLIAIDRGDGKYNTLRLKVSRDDLRSMKLPYPNSYEQKNIVAFLDEKCAKIDALAEIKSQQIEKLKELRQVKIHQAVTKGLDFNVELKDSGIDWIGEIPKHWEVSKVKNYLKIPITDGPHTTPELLDEGIPFISAEAIKNGKIDFSKKRGNISLNDYKLFSLKYIPKRNDIYMIKSGATTGNVAMVETDDIFTIWSPLAVFRVNHRVLARFLFNVLQSPYFKKSVELSWSFGTQQNIGMGVLGNLRVCIPPLSEQEAIVAYLGEVTGKIDQAIAQKQEQIEKLKQYKQSLINEVVTGKVMVC